MNGVIRSSKHCSMETVKKNWKWVFKKLAQPLLPSPNRSYRNSQLTNFTNYLLWKLHPIAIKNSKTRIINVEVALKIGELRDRVQIWWLLIFKWIYSNGLTFTPLESSENLRLDKLDSIPKKSWKRKVDIWTLRRINLVICVM